MVSSTFNRIFFLFISFLFVRENEHEHFGIPNDTRWWSKLWYVGEEVTKTNQLFKRQHRRNLFSFSYFRNRSSNGIVKIDFGNFQSIPSIVQRMRIGFLYAGCGIIAIVIFFFCRFEKDSHNSNKYALRIDNIAVLSQHFCLT